MEKVIWYNLNRFIIDKDNNCLIKCSGIYAYRFKLNKSKRYIGSAFNVAQRFRQHRYISFTYRANNNKLYNLVNKYGWDSM